MIYLDYAATTPLHPAALKAMEPYFSEKFGNASSIHAFGSEARAAVEAARDTIAASVGAKSEEIYFTSGGTESNNFALKGITWANRKKGRHIITSPIEHHAVLEPCRFLEKEGFKVTYLPVDQFGLVDPAEVKKALTAETILISVMQANNEIGTIEPIAEIGEIAREKDIYFHTDAVQSFGMLPLNVAELKIDLLSASAHKLYGPKGIGLLYIRQGTRITPFMQGGEQERGKRAGTHNVPAIVGFGKAVELAEKELLKEPARLKALRDKLIKGIFDRIEEVELVGHPEKRLSKNVSICIKYVEGESLLINLDLEGIAASTGSACSSGSLEPSHVLRAIGKSHELSHGSLRFTLGRLTTEKEIDYVLEVLPGIVKKLRAMSPLYKKKTKS